MNKQKRILVTGATGFTGGEVLKYLSQFYDNKNLIGTGRDVTKAKAREKLGLKMICGNLTEIDFIKTNFSDITHVVHCAAKSDVWGSYESFYKNNVVATKNILTLPNLEHIIYISTPSIYFNFRNRISVMESEPLPEKFVNNYSITKYLGELLVLNHNYPMAKKHIFRPRAIIGAGDTTLMPRLLRAYEEGSLKIIGSGENVGDFTSVKNLAHIIHLALEKSNQTEQIVFNVTDDNPVNLWGFINKSLEKQNLAPIKKKVPYRLAFSVAAINEWYNKVFFKNEPVLTKYGIGILNYSLTLNIDAAKKFLGYKPIVSSDDSIDDFVKWKKKKNENS